MNAYNLGLSHGRLASDGAYPCILYKWGTDDYYNYVQGWYSGYSERVL